MADRHDLATLGDEQSKELTPERWQKVEQVLEAARDRRPAEQAAYLDQACAADDELLGEFLAPSLGSLTAAGAQSVSQLQTVARSLAYSLMNSTVYAQRNRTDGQFITDLYWTYSQRNHDSGGYQAWLNALAQYGRAVTSDAFGGNAEFLSIVTLIYGTAADDNERMTSFLNKAYLVLARVPTSTELSQGLTRLNNAAAQGQSQTVSEAQAIVRELFTSTEYINRNRNDPLLERGEASQPQSWNRYSYTVNNPLKYTDPDGLRYVQRTLENGQIQYAWCATDECYDHAIDSKSKGYAGWTAVTFDESKPFTYLTTPGIGGELYSRYTLNPDGTNGFSTILEGGNAGLTTDWTAQFAIGSAIGGLMKAVGGGLGALLSHEAQHDAAVAAGSEAASLWPGTRNWSFHHPRHRVHGACYRADGSARLRGSGSTCLCGRKCH